MTNKQLQKVLQLDWEPWLKRPFFAFILSIFEGSNSKGSFNKVGLKNWEYISFMFDNGEWYWSEKVYEYVEPEIKKWLRNHKVSQIDEWLQIFYKNNKKIILELIKNPEKRTGEKSAKILNIFVELNTYIWITHLLEHHINFLLKRETPKYVENNIEKFVRDATYPAKKNALELMEREIRDGIDLKFIVNKYGWMRSRDGFSRAYNLRELRNYAKALNKKELLHKYPFVPKPLKGIFIDARELVYLRTRRTDILFEFLFLSRPIIKEIAKKYKISFSDLKYYTFQSLIKGKPIKYPKKFGCVSYKEKLYFFKKSIFTSNVKNKEYSGIKGAIAYSGLIKGRAKIVMKVSELNKVKKGDILVTYMTSPNFLPAMKLSSAFVTNEGGLTCHAAIIAREMKKPCVIGTKIATQVIKDGDLIEVDANKGLIKILKKTKK